MKINYDPIKDSWLGISEKDLRPLQNPLFTEISSEEENLYLRILRIMRNKRYLGWTTKTVLGIDLLPDQIAIMRELWHRPFPMYIASRGYGKALSKGELVRVANGWKKIEDIKVGDYVFGGNGKLAKVTGTSYKQENLNFYRIHLFDGRKI